MIMKCDHCGVTYDSAYGHYNCVPPAAPGPIQQETREARKTNKVPIHPLDVIDSWSLTYNLGAAIDKIGRFAFDANGGPQYLEEAIVALRREISRITGGNR